MCLTQNELQALDPLIDVCFKAELTGVLVVAQPEVRRAGHDAVDEAVREALQRLSRVADEDAVEADHAAPPAISSTRRSDVVARKSSRFKLRVDPMTFSMRCARCMVRGDPGDERERPVRLLLAACAPVDLVGAALARDRSRALGAAVDLEEPAVLEGPACGDDVEVGSKRLRRSAGSGEPSPAAGLDVHLDQVEPTPPSGAHELNVGLGDRQRVIEKERRGLAEAAAALIDQAATDRAERVDERGGARADPPDPPLEPNKQPLPAQASQHPAADTSTGLTGAVIGEVQLLDLTRCQEAVLLHRLDDREIPLRQLLPQLAEGPAAEVGAHPINPRMRRQSLPISKQNLTPCR